MNNNLQKQIERLHWKKDWKKIRSFPLDIIWNDKPLLLEFYKKQKLRKCCGFFDAMSRNSQSRIIESRLINHYNFTESELHKIIQDIQFDERKQ